MPLCVATFLWLEAAQCFAWGVLFAWQSLADGGVLGGNGHATVIFVGGALATTFTGRSAARASPSSSASAWRASRACACAGAGRAVGGVTTASAVMFLGVGAARPPEASVVAQLLWVGAWVPYWLRFVLMIPLYAITAVVLVARGRGVAWQRGALQLALFNLAMASLFLVPRLVLGVFTPAWLATDLVATPLAWVAYVPFLLWVLQRDSRFWVSSGFTACLLGNASGSEAELHRVPLLAQRASTGKVAPPRFLITAASSWKRRAAPRLYLGGVAVCSQSPSQMVVSHLTLEFPRLFLTEAECLPRAATRTLSNNGGCVAPPLVCLVMERCESNVHASSTARHRVDRAAAAARARLRAAPRGSPDLPPRHDGRHARRPQAAESADTPAR